MKTMTGLAACLDSIGVPANAYSLGEDQNESYCMVNEEGAWRVYYSERGTRNREKAFGAEETACRYLMSMLLIDGSVLRRLHKGLHN